MINNPLLSDAKRADYRENLYELSNMKLICVVMKSIFAWGACSTLNQKLNLLRCVGTYPYVRSQRRASKEIITYYLDLI